MRLDSFTSKAKFKAYIQAIRATIVDDWGLRSRIILVFREVHRQKRKATRYYVINIERSFNLRLTIDSRGTKLAGLSTCYNKFIGS